MASIVGTAVSSVEVVIAMSESPGVHVVSHRLSCLRWVRSQILRSVGDRCWKQPLRFGISIKAASAEYLHTRSAVRVRAQGAKGGIIGPCCTPPRPCDRRTDPTADRGPGRRLRSVEHRPGRVHIDDQRLSAFGAGTTVGLFRPGHSIVQLRGQPDLDVGDGGARPPRRSPQRVLATLRPFDHRIDRLGAFYAARGGLQRGIGELGDRWHRAGRIPAIARPSIVPASSEHRPGFQLVTRIPALWTGRGTGFLGHLGHRTGPGASAVGRWHCGLLGREPVVLDDGAHCP